MSYSHDIVDVFTDNFILSLAVISLTEGPVTPCEICVLFANKFAEPTRSVGNNNSVIKLEQGQDYINTMMTEDASFRNLLFNFVFHPCSRKFMFLPYDLEYAMEN